MKLIKKLMTILITLALTLCLSSCASFEDKARSNVDAYMKKMKNLTKDNYVAWVNENLGNPYLEVGLTFDKLKDSQIEYFIKCLSMMDYEIVKIDEVGKTAEVKVTYVDSTEYISKTFEKLLTYAFSPDYTEEGEDQIYKEAMNEIDEYQFVEDTVYLGLFDDGSIGIATSNMFDVATAGIYRLMLGDPSEAAISGAKYSAEELLANVEVTCEVLDENNMLVTFKNNNEVSVNPIADIIFTDAKGNYVIQSQASVEVLPPGMTSCSYAYNELNEEATNFHVEMQIAYYEPDEIKFYDESLVPYEIKQTNDEVDIVFTNNMEETVEICGSYVAYGIDESIICVGDIYISSLDPGCSDKEWFYLNCTYDEKTDTFTPDPYGRIDVFPIIHSPAQAIWCN